MILRQSSLLYADSIKAMLQYFFILLFVLLQTEQKINITFLDVCIKGVDNFVSDLYTFLPPSTQESLQNFTQSGLDDIDFNG